MSKINIKGLIITGSLQIYMYCQKYLHWFGLNLVFNVF